MDSRDYSVILHMLKYCNEIHATIQRYGEDVEIFTKDVDYKDSISMKIFQIGELTNHLTSEYLELTKNEVNWNAIRGMRNRFAHGYIEMDLKKIYYTAVNDIPVLKQFIEKQIAKTNKE